MENKNFKYERFLKSILYTSSKLKTVPSEFLIDKITHECGLDIPEEHMEIY